MFMKSKADANECEWRIVRFEDDNDFDPTDLRSIYFVCNVRKTSSILEICVMRQWRSTTAALTPNLSSWNSSASDL
jgi:hypothetical protein